MVCRVCLEGCDCSLQIFDRNGEELDIANILEQHFWFKPLPNDSVSTIICRLCWGKVNSFHQFYLAVEQAHSQLNEQNVKDELYETETAPLEVVVQVKEELQDNEWGESDADNEKNNPLYDPGIAENAHAIERQLENEINAHADETEEEESIKDPAYKVWKPPADKTKIGTRTRLQKRKACDGIDDSKAVSEKRRQYTGAFTSHDDELIKKYIPMGCDLCTFVGEDFSQIREHFKEQHENIKPYVVCCDRKLRKRLFLVQHACKHENPNFFKCEECQKVLSSRYLLRLHMAANHAPEAELKYKCDQCEKRFSRLTFLKKHLPSHIPENERQFICDKCPEGKAFASMNLLQIHVSMRHTRVPNVCDICAKEIRDKQAFAKHMRAHYGETEPRVKCPKPGCNSWLKDEENLRHHLGRHNDEGKIYTCETCGKECKNRKSLSSHIHYAHTTEVFPCELCQKTFKKAITLKEHMAQHTGETLYKCPYCTRTFNSNANMHSHKKKIHPIEWAQNKRNFSQPIVD